jgi:hypothetical protein
MKNPEEYGESNQIIRSKKKAPIIVGQKAQSYDYPSDEMTLQLVDPEI